MNAFEKRELTTLVPISIDTDEMSVDTIIKDISELNEKYGLDLFILACPNKGWRSIGLPPVEVFEKAAERFRKIKEALAPRGITFGWWIVLTLKPGVDKRFTHMMRFDGIESAIGICPLDPDYQKALCDRIKRFVDIARPELIITEDDFSVHAAAGSFGCFCKHHLKEFSLREGKEYTREELYSILATRSVDSLPLLRRWRALIKDSITGLASKIRQTVDEVSPDIPIGCCQPGAVDADGDATEDFARALAGSRHTPFSRLYGTFYCGGDSKDIPVQAYHALYSKQHIKEPFSFFHEADCFPHSRYFTSGKQMRALMATTASYGMDGFLMQTQQLIDDPNEEAFVFGGTFEKERARFIELFKKTRACRVKGVEITFDPFLFRASESKSSNSPLWVKCLSLFGIPYTTERADIAFWDERMARFASDETIKEYLSGKLFLDANGARYLVDRGYGEYLGIEVGNDVSKENNLATDLAATEVISDKYTQSGKGKRMPSAHMFAQGKNGVMRKITVKNPEVEVITELCKSSGDVVCPGICKFKNSLGGTVVVMGITLDKNGSQSLLNNCRARLMKQLLDEIGADIAYAKEEPCLFTVMNEPKSADTDILGMLTLINLCEDAIPGVEIRLPSSWQGVREILSLGTDGNWQSISFEKTPDGVKLADTLRYSEPNYLLFR